MTDRRMKTFEAVEVPLPVRTQVEHEIPGRATAEWLAARVGKTSLSAQFAPLLFVDAELLLTLCRTVQLDGNCERASIRAHLPFPTDVCRWTRSLQFRDNQIARTLLLLN